MTTKPELLPDEIAVYRRTDAKFEFATYDTPLNHEWTKYIRADLATPAAKPLHAGEVAASVQKAKDIIAECPLLYEAEQQAIQTLISAAQENERLSTENAEMKRRLGGMKTINKEQAQAAQKAISSGENAHGEYNGDMDYLRQFIPTFKAALQYVIEDKP